MLVGDPAIDKLARFYPNAHNNFGLFPSTDHFSLVLTQPSWVVLEEDWCWLMAESVGGNVWDCHWFCPRGAKMPAIRRMLHALFNRGASILVGTVPRGHPNRRAANVLNLSTGAERQGNGFILSRERFLRYNSGKSGM